MTKNEKMLNAAINQAYNSNINIRHGAVITKGSKIICKGFNNSRSRIKSLNNLELCTHAEIDVVRKLYNLILSKKNKSKKYNLRKYTIWVARISQGDKGNTLYSAPCNKCISFLRKMGFYKVGFSDHMGNPTVVKIDKFNNSHLSDAQQSLVNFKDF